MIDIAVHPAMADDDEIRAYLVEPYSFRYIPPLERNEYPIPPSERRKPIPEGAGVSLKRTEQDLFAEGGRDIVILVPNTRGLVPDVNMGNAICSATNDWLARTWLSLNEQRYRGSIRINPRDPAGAVAEIERWAANPAMVQVAVPLESHHPYGERQYEPIWRAAAQHGLPIAILADGGGQTEPAPTVVGYPRWFAEYSIIAPLNSLVHVMSFIVLGVFERVPDLRVVLLDGAGDVAIPLLWRTDKDWNSLHSATPWVKQLPTDYLLKHCRFCVNRMEGPTEATLMAEWCVLGEAAKLLMYGSRYPRWNYLSAEELATTFPESMLKAITTGNAQELYRL